MSRRARAILHPEVIHKIDELVIDLDSDSLYSRDRNRVDCKISKAIIKPKAIVDNSVSIKWATRKISPHEQKIYDALVIGAR